MSLSLFLPTFRLPSLSLLPPSFPPSLLASGSDSWTAAERRQFNKGITAYKKDFFMVQKQVCCGFKHKNRRMKTLNPRLGHIVAAGFLIRDFLCQLFTTLPKNTVCTQCFPWLWVGGEKGKYSHSGTMFPSCLIICSVAVNYCFSTRLQKYLIFLS